MYTENRVNHILQPPPALLFGAPTRIYRKESVVHRIRFNAGMVSSRVVTWRGSAEQLSPVQVNGEVLQLRKIYEGGSAMNWDQVEGKWKQFKGQAKEKWGKLTDDDLDVIDGRRQQLVGRLQERYGIAKDAAEKQADEFVNTLKSEDLGADRAYRAGQH
jgi:uncharacterized protein YjbJ (UPF0337 family)